MNILENILETKRREMERSKKERSREALLEEISRGKRVIRSLKKALLQSQSGIIAEFKRRSPSKGWIHENAGIEIVREYEKAGAAAISVLTDTSFFGGSLEDLKAARRCVNVPILRKDFIIDSYQLEEARAAGADAVLLIAAALSKMECQQLTARAHELELEVLLELREAVELDYVDTGADVVGINNRDLRTFHVDAVHSLELGERLPVNVVKISESGVSQPETVRTLRAAGFAGVLIGETFMCQKNPGEALAAFLKELR